MRDFKISRRLMTTAALLMACALITGCGKKTEETAAEPSGEAVSEEASLEETEAEPQYISLLTGEGTTKRAVTRRPVAMMIENTYACLPQYGINKAGVIYECPVEGGITRLMGVFDDYSRLKRFGNVRSCRPYYVYLASEYDAIYVHFGQSKEGLALLNTGIIDDLNGLNGSMNDVFYRTSDKAAPHNAYTSTDQIKKGIKIMGYRTRLKESAESHFQFSFDSPVVPDGKKARVIRLYYMDNKPYFIYSSKSGLYKRYEYGQKQKDGNDGKQIKVKNIILQYVDSSKYSDGLKLNIPLNGTGKGLYISNGRMEDITWEKDSDTSVTHYYDTDGEEIKLNPGRTWVSLIENQYVSSNSIYKNLKEAGL